MVSDYTGLFMSNPYYQLSRDGRYLGLSGTRTSDGKIVGFIVDLIDKKRASVDFVFTDYSTSTA